MPGAMHCSPSWSLPDRTISMRRTWTYRRALRTNATAVRRPEPTADWRVGEHRMQALHPCDVLFAEHKAHDLTRQDQTEHYSSENQSNAVITAAGRVNGILVTRATEVGRSLGSSSLVRP